MLGKRIFLDVSQAVLLNCVLSLVAFVGAVHKAGLRVVKHKFNLVRCPFRDAYIAKKGDPVKHAKVNETYRAYKLQIVLTERTLLAVSPQGS